jgi:hypothetical protein
MDFYRSYMLDYPFDTMTPVSWPHVIDLFYMGFDLTNDECSDFKQMIDYWFLKPTFEGKEEYYNEAKVRSDVCSYFDLPKDTPQQFLLDKINTQFPELKRFVEEEVDTSSSVLKALEMCNLFENEDKPVPEFVRMYLYFTRKLKVKTSLFSPNKTTFLIYLMFHDDVSTYY